MRLDELAEKIGAKVVTPGLPLDRVIGRVYAGDRMSDLLTQASEATLLVTNLANSQLVRVAGLMDLPAICLLGGHVPDPDLVSAAIQHGTVLLVSPSGMFETCGRLYECVRAEHKAGS